MANVGWPYIVLRFFKTTKVTKEGLLRVLRDLRGNII
jgi:hypothetical protein